MACSILSYPVFFHLCLLFTLFLLLPPISFSIRPSVHPSTRPPVSLPLVLFLFHPFLPLLFFVPFSQPTFLSIKGSQSPFRNVLMIHFHFFTEYCWHLAKSYACTLPITHTLSPHSLSPMLLRIIYFLPHWTVVIPEFTDPDYEHYAMLLDRISDLDICFGDDLVKPE